MDLVLDNVAKLYSDDWVFRHLKISIKDGQSWAVMGHNGSGKSTLLSVVMGLTLPSEGEVRYFSQGKGISREEAPLHLSFCAPYMSVPEELSAIDLLKHFRGFRPLFDGMDERRVLELAQLWRDRNKPVSQFSTGMKQRFRLALAFTTRSQAIILDEPTSNLDEEGKVWFLNLIDQYRKRRTMLIASNDKFDLDLCEEQLVITDYKPNPIIRGAL